jgi:hypothetical protein
VSFDPLDETARLALAKVRRDGADAERARIIVMLRESAVTEARRTECVRDAVDGPVKACALFMAAQMLDRSPIN